MSITLNDKPVRASSTSPEPADDGSVTVVTRQGEVLELNATAAALWALCDGHTAVSEIVSAATTFFAGQPDTIEHDIMMTLEELKKQNLIGL